MTDAELTALEALACEATPGPECGTDYIYLAAGLLRLRPWDDNPTVDDVLRQSAVELRRLGDEVRRLRQKVECDRVTMDLLMERIHERVGRDTEYLRCELTEARAEVDRLRAGRLCPEEDDEGE